MNTLQEVLFARAAALGFPAVDLRPGVRVLGGEDGWRKFTAFPDMLDVHQADRALLGLEIAADFARRAGRD